jgi:hypothetical protein
MTGRRSLGMLALLAMMHLIILGTVSSCAAPRGNARASAAGHGDCAPSSSHSKGDRTDRATEQPCCAALASCSATALAARTVAVVGAAPMVAIASDLSERAPRADAPAPELPPPRA